MKRFAILGIFILILASNQAQNVKVVDFNSFQPELEKQNDTLYMVHFWATWCIPCMKEMPVILKETAQIKGAKFKLVLVSFDFTKDINSKLIPFLQKQDFHQNVFVMDDPDYNSWINKVDESWSGGLPATLFFRGKHKSFFEGTFSEGELEKTIQNKLKTL